MNSETRRYIEEFHMVDKGDVVLVGLSGGADSVGLLVVLNDLKEELGIELQALHLNHGIRGEEAERDAEYSRTLCESLAITYTYVKRNVFAMAEMLGLSVEEAGRKARYDAFRERASQIEAETGRRVRIAVAHHSDDSAETFLHNLFRGSGFAGLTGISPVRDDIIRPMLWTSHEAICEFLNSRGIPWVEDSTNSGTDYTRNYIRNQLLPSVKENVNLKASENILRTASYISEADEYFEEEAERFASSFAKTEGLREISVPCEEFLELKDILKGYVVRWLLKSIECPLKDITSAHINSVKELAGKGTGRSADLPYGVKVRTEYGRLKIRRAPSQEEKASDDPEKSSDKEENGAICGYKFNIKEIYGANPSDFPKEPFRKWFDSDRIDTDSLVMRTRKQGDYLILPGGGRKTVKSFMIDNKIPKDCRDTIPVIADGSHVIWLVGYRISEGAKITEDTKNIIEVSIKGGSSND